jgi:3-methyladenine DNA glycosylase AlkC
MISATMAEAFKEWIGPDLVKAVGRQVQRVHSSFPRPRFVRRACQGLAELELKARVVHVADALFESLPTSFSDAVGVLEQTLAPARLDTDLSKLVSTEHGLAGWAVWPMTDYVARYGLGHPKRALRALHALTQRNTAEYAIRPYLIEHRDLTMSILHEWVSDPSPHVRRLVSEGTRPRLPWGVQLKYLVEDPSPTFPLLEQLQDDESDYVRRSVANHLNDIARDHPDQVAAWLTQFLPGASQARLSMLRHASRTLIKRGDRRTLKAWGLSSRLRGEVAMFVDPADVTVGGSVNLRVELISAGKRPQSLVLDYVVHHVKKDGTTRMKTWKGWQLQLMGGERRTLRKRHSLRPVTTRRDYPGRHQVDLMVNGQVMASSAFVLRP